MESRGVSPSYATYNHLLQACMDAKSLNHGLKLHEHLISKTSIRLPLQIKVKLVKLYCVCGEINKARQLFDEIPQPDCRCWAAMINAYSKYGYPNESLKLYSDMKFKNGIQPDKFILLAVAKACSMLSDLVKAKEIHEDAERFCPSSILVKNALIDLYGKCGCMHGASLIFNKLPEKDVISWTSMIVGLVQCGHWEDALQLFSKMVLAGVQPNSVTISSVLAACSSLLDLNLGRIIHGYVIRIGIEDNVLVSGALIDMYAKCLNVLHARRLFDISPQRDVVSWNVICAAYLQSGEVEKAIQLFQEMKSLEAITNVASWNVMISGCAQNGETVTATELFEQMVHEGVKPNHITIASFLPALSSIESRRGRELHSYCFRHCFIEDTIVATAVISMYANCGSLNIALKVFNEMLERDTISWNVVIRAYAMHGYGMEALAVFQKMQKMGVRPNAGTFAGVLSACSHAGLVEEGYRFFHSMSMYHGLVPDADHYASMVDILSRAGLLNDAYLFIQNMPVKATASSWGALLGACRVYKNINLGKIAARYLFQIEPDNPGNYILLANMYIALGMSEDALNMRKLMRNRGIEKTPGCSWVQVRGQIYTFVAGDKSHVQKGKIYAYLHELNDKMKLAGYLPDTRFALADVDFEEKEEVLGYHSEKLAVAYALLNTESASTICIFKNIRICGDCHNAMKFLSDITGVRITIRDSIRFHHFSNGFCSCQDFW
ncbi:Pentatricopeptide repeat-containing protein [Nymphaea thermarum]|nr:Pentatricopeptide repeat-containing protein [Nymphaea thermarum]